VEIFRPISRFSCSSRKFCLKAKKEFQIRTEELRRRRLLKGGNFQTRKQIFMLIQKILLEVKERIPDKD